MADAKLNNNVVTLTAAVGKQALTLDMSLQRHHYRYCGTAAALEVNSLLFASVDDKTVVAEGIEVAQQIETLLAKTAKFSDLFGKKLTVKSGRTYLVDNSALDPSGRPNHYFVTGGPSVWAKMTQNQFVAASAIRRVDEAIAARAARKDKVDYLDAKTLAALDGNNPVIAAYVAANTALKAVPNDDANLAAVSNQAQIVARARKKY